VRFDDGDEDSDKERAAAEHKPTNGAEDAPSAGRASHEGNRDSHDELAEERHGDHVAKAQARGGGKRGGALVKKARGEGVWKSGGDGTGEVSGEVVDVSHVLCEFCPVLALIGSHAQCPASLSCALSCELAPLTLTGDAAPCVLTTLHHGSCVLQVIEVIFQHYAAIGGSLGEWAENQYYEFLRDFDLVKPKVNRATTHAQCTHSLSLRSARQSHRRCPTDAPRLSHSDGALHCAAGEGMFDGRLLIDLHRNRRAIDQGLSRARRRTGGSGQARAEEHTQAAANVCGRAQAPLGRRGHARPHPHCTQQVCAHEEGRGRVGCAAPPALARPPTTRPQQGSACGCEPKAAHITRNGKRTRTRTPHA
jgi:hypothetical protein